MELSPTSVSCIDPAIPLCGLRVKVPEVAVNCIVRVMLSALSACNVKDAVFTPSWVGLKFITAEQLALGAKLNSLPDNDPQLFPVIETGPCADIYVFFESN